MSSDINDIAFCFEVSPVLQQRLISDVIKYSVGEQSGWIKNFVHVSGILVTIREACCDIRISSYLFKDFHYKDNTAVNFQV